MNGRSQTALFSVALSDSVILLVLFSGMGPSDLPKGQT